MQDFRQTIQVEYYGIPTERIEAGHYKLGRATIQRTYRGGWAISGLGPKDNLTYRSASAALSAAGYAQHKEA